MGDNLTSYGIRPYFTEETEEDNGAGQDEDRRSSIGNRILAIPAQAGVIPRGGAAQTEEPDAPPPTPVRMVDMQRQQQMLADLTRPAVPPPAPQQAQGRPAPGAGAGRSNGAAAPGAQAPAASAPVPAKRSAAPAPGAQRSSPARPPQAAAPAAQPSGGNQQQGGGSWLDRATNYVGDLEKKARDTVSSVGQKIGDAAHQAQDTAAAVGHKIGEVAKDAEDTALGWFPRLWQTKDGDAPAAKQQAAGSAGSAGTGQAAGQGAAGQKPRPKGQQPSHFGERNWKAGNRADAPHASSSDGGKNIYTPPKGQQITDLIKNGYIKDDNGEAQCVQLVKTAVGAPATAEWRPGMKVTKGANIPPGTVIATFVDGRYPSGKAKPGETIAGSRHAAIYLGQDENGIWVVDQANRDKDTGKPVIQKRLIPWEPTSSGRSNDGNAFSVITWNTQAGKQSQGGAKAPTRRR